MGVMFPYRWSDGTWRPHPEPGPEQELPAVPAPNPKPKRNPQGCFKQSPLSPRQRALRADTTRLWLRAILAEPMPAVEVLRRAKLEHIPERSLRRAKRRLGIRAYKRGGRHGRYGARWFWSTPRMDSAEESTL